MVLSLKLSSTFSTIHKDRKQKNLSPVFSSDPETIFHKSLEPSAALSHWGSIKTAASHRTSHGASHHGGSHHFILKTTISPIKTTTHTPAHTSSAPRHATGGSPGHAVILIEHVVQLLCLHE